MGSHGLVSIRLEGFSITIADGNISIEQTRTEAPVVSALPKVERRQASAVEAVLREETSAVPNGAAPAVVVAVESVAQAVGRQSILESLGDSVGPNGHGAGVSAVQFEEDTLVTDSPPGRAIAKLWSGEEVERLKALYPTHSASAIAKELGRGFNAVRAKAQSLGLKRNGPPEVTAKPPRDAKSALTPKSLSAAATTDLAPVTSGRLFCAAVPLLEHHAGQCRWLVSDVWPALYCGAPVVGSSSWCSYHSARVFTCRPASVGRFRLKAFAW